MYLPSSLPIPFRLVAVAERAALRSRPWDQPQGDLVITAGQVEARLIALGDVCLNQVGLRTSSEIFGPLLDLLESADIITCNLEGPLTTSSLPAGSIGSFLKADPSRVASLARFGFSLVNLANNHILDYGQHGLDETLDCLHSNGISICGVSVGPREFPKPTVFHVRGLRIGFLGFCDDHYPVDLDLDRAHPTLLDNGTASQTVRSAKSTVDVLIVHIHWGYEFALHPLRRSRDVARQLVDHGADLVLCHHAHVNQGMERWRRGVIIYGLGNAVMPQSPYMQSGHQWTNRSVAVEVTIGKDGLRWVRVHPFAIGLDGSMQPIALHPARDLLAGIRRMSSRLRDDRFLGEIERAVIVLESVRLISALRKEATLGDEPLCERARTLTLPRQQRLIGYVRTLVPGIGQMLQELAASADNVQKLRSTWERYRKTLSGARIALMPYYSWRATFRSRVP